MPERRPQNRRQSKKAEVPRMYRILLEGQEEGQVQGFEKEGLQNWGTEHEGGVREDVARKGNEG